jgi:hypothetical protein
LPEGLNRYFLLATSSRKTAMIDSPSLRRFCFSAAINSMLTEMPLPHKHGNGIVVLNYRARRAELLERVQDDAAGHAISGREADELAEVVDAVDRVDLPGVSGFAHDGLQVVNIAVDPDDQSAWADVPGAGLTESAPTDDGCCVVDELGAAVIVTRKKRQFESGVSGVVLLENGAAAEGRMARTHSLADIIQGVGVAAPVVTEDAKVKLQNPNRDGWAAKLYGRAGR